MTVVRFGESAEKEKRAKALLREGELTWQRIAAEVGTSKSQVGRFASELRDDGVAVNGQPTRTERLEILADECAALQREVDGLRDRHVEALRDMTRLWALAGQLNGEVWSLQNPRPGATT